MGQYLTWFEFIKSWYMAGVHDGGNEDNADDREIRTLIRVDGLDPDADSPVRRT